MKKIFYKAKRIYKIYKALSSDEGKRIIKELKGGEKNAGQLKENPKTSYYLKSLLNAGIIQYTPKRTERLYRINDETLLKYLKADTEDFVECCWALSGRFRFEIITKLRKDGEAQIEYSPLNSKELKRMLNVGLVERRQDGRKAFWQVTEKAENLFQKIEEL